jgi:hypothetical protein
MPSGPVSASGRDVPVAAAEGHDPLTSTVRPQWLVTCSCGWTSEFSQRWAAESAAKLHPKLGEPDTAHVVTIENPSTDRAGGGQLPLI